MSHEVQNETTNNFKLRELSIDGLGGFSVRDCRKVRRLQSKEKFF